MNETVFRFTFDVFPLVALALALWWVKWVLSAWDDDDEEEEPAMSRTIIPALPGYFVLELAEGELESGLSPEGVVSHFTQWPVIGWEIEGETNLQPPRVITTAGIENGYAAILLPNGKVHVQDGEIFANLVEYADDLMRSADEESAS